MSKVLPKVLQAQSYAHTVYIWRVEWPPGTYPDVHPAASTWAMQPHSLELIYDITQSGKYANTKYCVSELADPLVVSAVLTGKRLLQDGSLGQEFTIKYPAYVWYSDLQRRIPPWLKELANEFVAETGLTHPRPVV